MGSRLSEVQERSVKIAAILSGLAPAQSAQMHNLLLRATTLEVRAIFHRRASYALGA